MATPERLSSRICSYEVPCQKIRRAWTCASNPPSATECLSRSTSARLPGTRYKTQARRYLARSTGWDGASRYARLGVVQARLTIARCTLHEANAYSQKWHRYHGRGIGAKFSVAVRAADQVRGVAIGGRSGHVTSMRALLLGGVTMPKLHHALTFFEYRLDSVEWIDSSNGRIRALTSA